MKVRSLITGLIIVLAPFVIGIFLFLTRGMPDNAHQATDTIKSSEGMAYKGIKVDWTFYPDWKYKPLFLHADEYLVFMFHYTNNSAYDVVLTPSYTFASPNSRRYSANEEIAMYIEDGLEKELKANDEISISFKVAPNAAKHYIVTFEKPQRLKQFYVDVDIFRDVTLRIHYRKENNSWADYKNELVKKYEGRG